MNKHQNAKAKPNTSPGTLRGARKPGWEETPGDSQAEFLPVRPLLLLYGVASFPGPPPCHCPHTPFPVSASHALTSHCVHLSLLVLHGRCACPALVCLPLATPHH